MDKPLYELDQVYRVLNRAFSSLSIDELLTAVTDEVKEVLGADRCTLFLIDKEAQELYSKVLQADELAEIRLPLHSQSLAGFVATHSTAINVKDAYDEKKLKQIDRSLRFDFSWDEQSGYRTKSALVVPVRTKTETIGALQALNKTGGFTAADVALSERLAFFLGIAVHNSMLYQAVEEERQLKQHIIDGAEDGICIIDTDKKIVSGNRFLKIMSGLEYRVEEMIGQDFFKLFSQFAATDLSKKIDEVLQSGFERVSLMQVMQVKIIPYLDDHGKVKRLILFFKII
jgi:adenylate cyclase